MDLNTSKNFDQNNEKALPPKVPKNFIEGYIKVAKSPFNEPHDRFAARLEEIISPGLPAKDLVSRIVTAALESEFGPGFTQSKGFDKMVSAISDSIVANPDLRRQSLAIASEYMEKKIMISDEKKNSDNREKKGPASGKKN